MLVRFAACSAVVTVITTGYIRLLHVNPTTVALTFLVAVLTIAAAWGLKYSVYTSLIATACFNFFFLPPARTWTISDPQNWIALAVFLITAMIASQLSDKARRQAAAAEKRMQDRSGAVTQFSENPRRASENADRPSGAQSTD